MNALILLLTLHEDTKQNPLLKDFTTPYETPPFNLIKTEDYEPAFNTAIEEAKAEIEAIATSPTEATFENTIVALDAAGERLNRIAEIFFNLNSCLTNEEIQEIAQRVSPKLTEYGHSIYMNTALFHRVQKVRENCRNLDPEDSRLLESTWKAFIDGGANLEGEAKKRFKEISIELSKLSLTFDKNELAETNNFELHLTDEADLAGLPEGVREAAAIAAQEKGKEGWIFNLQAPSYIPFLRYADNRQLREKIYKAYSRRGFQANEYNNEEIVKRITALRLEKARIMGYNTYAEYALTKRMAKNPENVNRFIEQLHGPSYKASCHEKEEVEAFAQKHGLEGELQRWDWPYYSNKLKQEKYAFDDEMLRPYFQLENVQQGIFGLATKLYGITFEKISNIPVYHEDVTTFKVNDRDGNFLAILYLDFFPRESKTTGAWMTQFRGQRQRNGKDIRPLVSLVMNFTKPTPSKPSLLTFNEVTTFLHEFGHALHGMLSRCRYDGTSMDSVYRDFVELPSQFMENYALEKEWLDTWAVHYQTGEKIPQEFIDKIRKSANFQSGYASDRQLCYGMIDMAWHSITQPVSEPLIEFERRVMSRTEIMPTVEGSAFSTAFGHIFAGGYAAGYYGYKWAEVLDADAFSVFKKQGIFNPETASSFRHNILERGNSEDPMELYKRFRGQEPTVDALLERSGLSEEKTEGVV